MRAAVIGTGAIGGTIAALLAGRGHRVEATARGAQLEALREHGLRLRGAWGEHRVRVEAGEELRSRPELAFLTTKAQDAEAALRANAGLLDGIPVVVVQNGLGAEHCQELLPGSEVIGGLAVFAASYLAPGEVTVTTAGPTYLGTPGTGRASGVAARRASPAARSAGRLLGEVMPVRVLDDFAGAQWTKLVVNEINALPAITGLSAQEVIADRGLRAVMTEGMREAVRTGHAAGVRFASLQGLSDPILSAFARAPAPVAQLLPLLMGRRMGSTPNPGSTLQSIRRGQKSEIDYLNGAVARVAREHGAAAPVNEALTALVHEVERTGRFLAPDEVTRAICP